MKTIAALKLEIEKERVLLRVKVGESLKKHRQDRNITQEELSKAVGISRTSICNIEVGINNMTIEQLISFSEFFNTTPNDILKEVFNVTNSEVKHDGSTS